MTSANIYIGLMSGTSIDSVDAVAVVFHPDRLQLLGNHSHVIPERLRRSILMLSQARGDTVQLYGETDAALGVLFAEATLAIMSKLSLTADMIMAVGSHGQTVRHQPPSGTALGFSLQIGDASIIAARTGCTVVADFRRKDIALGGQGAPLVPAFHQKLFTSSKQNRVIANIGGIANISILPANGGCSGFDTGPGNMLLDAWCHKNTGNAYDDNGNWSARGSADIALLNRLKSHPFISLDAPKSTGREDFNLSWLEQQLTGLTLTAEDIQATLVLFTAQTIADAIRYLDTDIDELYVCGGGAFNSQLMAKLETSLGEISVQSTKKLGLDANWVEACAFAWLAKQRIDRQCGNLAAVTGASRPTVLGAVYLP